MMKAQCTQSEVTTGLRQLELGLAEGGAGAVPPPGRRVARAHWWFDQMHRAVHQAMDWRVRPSRAEQV